MDLDKYINDNLDEILDNSDKYVNSSNQNKKINKKVTINEANNDIVDIEENKNYFDENTLDDSDEKEYLNYNYEYFDNFNEYYDIGCDCNSDTDSISNTDSISDNDDEYNNENYNNENYNNYEYNNDNQNEDNYDDDIVDELYEKMYESSQPISNPKELFINENNIEIEPDDEKIEPDDEKIEPDDEKIEPDAGYYFLNLMNIFIKYYNNKYDKKEHFFSNINNIEKDTTNQMELFFDAITEHKMMIEEMELDNDEAMKQLYTELEPEKISLMFEKWNKQIYMFELDELKLFSPSLIVCLNYIFEKKILNLDWNIYNLRDN
jgi:hypothetical protein